MSQNQLEQSKSVLTKLQPQNIEAEESILSSMLLDSDSLYDISEYLTADDFYKISHQKIFRAAIELYNQGEPVDLVSLANKLQENNNLERIGGATFLAQLVDTIPMAVNTEYHAKIIKGKSSLRRLIKKSTQIVEQCYNNSGNVEEIINFAEKSITQISEKIIRDTYTTINTLVHDNITTIEDRQASKKQFTGIPTGYNKLDAMLSGLQNSDLIIIAARPSMGKTAFALNIARNIAVEENIPVAVFSLEMSKEQLSMRLLTSEAMVSSTRIKGEGYLDDDDWRKINDPPIE